MSSYLSSLLTSTTDRYNSLRRNLLTTETDGDTDDDSHISRVLRAYYTEKSRPLPPWLPPDPKTLRSPTPTTAAAANSTMGGPGYTSLWGGGGGGAAQQAATSPIPGPAGKSALSDLWDTGPQQQRPVSGPRSLRAGGDVGGGGGGGGRALGSVGVGNVNVRPLPSQRAGSYQTRGRAASPGAAAAAGGGGGGGGGGGYQGTALAQHNSAPASAAAAGGGGGTAQERLKARLWGQAGAQQGRAGSPGPGYGGQGAGGGGYGGNRWG